MAEDANVKWIVDDAFKMVHIEKSSIDILLDKGMIVPRTRLALYCNFDLFTFGFKNGTLDRYA
jgi:hypothetical protein